MGRLAATLLALSLTACTSSSYGTDRASYADDKLVLQLHYAGGLRLPDPTREVPFWSLYGDGRIVTPAPRPDNGARPALVALQVRTVSRATVDRIVRAARAAGIDGVQRDYGDVRTIDVPATVFRLGTDGGGYVTTTVTAITIYGHVYNEARIRLRAFYLDLTGDAFGSGGETPYEPERVVLFATAYGLPRNGAEPRDGTWSGPDPAAGEPTRDGLCTVIAGDALGPALHLLGTADADTRWHASGQEWAFETRPLLPHEEGCADAQAVFSLPDA